MPPWDPADVPFPFQSLLWLVPNGSSFPKVVWPFSFLHCCHQGVSGPGKDVSHEAMSSKRATQYTKPCCGAGDQYKPALSKTTTIFPVLTHEGNGGLAMWDEEDVPPTWESHTLSFESLCYAFDWENYFLIDEMGTIVHPNRMVVQIKGILAAVMQEIIMTNSSCCYLAWNPVSSSESFQLSSLTTSLWAG